MPVWLPCTVPMLLKVENNVVSAVYVLYDIYAMSAEWLSKLAVIFHFPFCSVKIGLGGGCNFSEVCIWMARIKPQAYFYVWLPDIVR